MSIIKRDVRTKGTLTGRWIVLQHRSYTREKNILTSRYGNVSEAVNAHFQAIMALPIIHGSYPIRIHKFYEKMLTHVQSLETMGKLKTIEGYVM